MAPSPPQPPKRPKRLRPRLEPKVGKGRRKALAKELRGHLAAQPMNVAEMAERLDVTPETVVVLLRELRSRKRGTLRSTIRLGHAAWWWVPTPGHSEGDGPPDPTP
ncbi:MAG TPA: hypothetical protein VFG86_08645 [Chloroflexota bacterium]|jgi:hypothetical protein|nr:hypothetical protein [Chloroflexota bacterium]